MRDPWTRRRPAPLATALLLIMCSLILACGGGCLRSMGDQDPDKTAALLAATGPYLGQTVPGDEPELFAPGVVSAGPPARDMTFTPDGKEMYFCWTVGSYDYSAILCSREIDGRWTEPEVASFSTDSRFSHIEPHVCADGSRLFFVSDRPDSAAGRLEKNEDIWIVDRIGDGWGEPYNPGPPLNGDGAEFFPTTTSDGSVYFTRREPGQRVENLLRCRPLPGGGFAESELLPEQVNGGSTRFNGFVSPDESYIITCIFGRDDSLGGVDYYVSFRDTNDVWTGPFNMGEKVNRAEGREWSPSVSPDGRYFFFMSTRLIAGAENRFQLSRSEMLRMHQAPGYGNSAIWWVDAGFLEKLRP